MAKKGVTRWMERDEKELWHVSSTLNLKSDIEQIERLVARNARVEHGAVGAPENIGTVRGGCANMTKKGVTRSKYCIRTSEIMAEFKIELG